MRLTWYVRDEHLWKVVHILPRIFDMGTRWRWAFSFMPRSLYPPRYPPASKPCGLYSQSERYSALWRSESSLAHFWYQTPIPQLSNPQCTWITPHVHLGTIFFLHKYNFRLKQKREEWGLDSPGSELEPENGTCEQVNNPRSSIMGGKFMTT